MKITNNRDKKVRFDSIKDGDIFILTGEILMKIETTYCDDNGYYENAVFLEDGRLMFCEDDFMVIPVECELVI